MKCAAIYVRVSTEEQKKHGLSVDNQIDALTQYCEQKGIEYRIYNDAGISAHASYKKRPALLQLISDCKKNEVSIILFTRLDRWFRSVKDYYLVQEQICNVPWKAIWEDYQTETSDGMLKVNILLSVAEAEAARTSEKIKSVMEYKRAKGDWLGAAPLGFKIVNNKLVIDETKEQLVRKMFDTYFKTRSSSAVQEVAKEYKFYDNQTIRRMLKNTAYIGTYISQEEHDLIINLMQTRTKLSKQVRDYIFPGFIVCPKCGRIMISYTSGNGKRKAYRCKKDGCSFTISEKKFERLIISELKPQLDKTSIEASVKPKANNNDARKKLKAKLDRLKELYIDADIDKEMYLKKKTEIEKKIAELPVSENKELPVLPDNWLDMYNSLTPKNKKAFWNSIIQKAYIAEDKMFVSFLFVERGSIET